MGEGWGEHKKKTPVLLTLHTPRITRNTERGSHRGQTPYYDPASQPGEEVKGQPAGSRTLTLPFSPPFCSDDLPPDSPSGEEGKREGEGEPQPQVQPQQHELQAQPQPEPQTQPKPEGTSVGETQQEVTPAASCSPSGGELEQEERERGDKAQEEEEIKQKEVVDSQQEQQHEGEAAVEADVEEEDGAEARGGAAGRRASLHHTASPMRVQRNGACSHSATSDYELSLDLKNKQRRWIHQTLIYI
eukprot:XP_014009167.1 PREDICTED: zinc finger protein 428 [Salmo salar]